MAEFINTIDVLGDDAVVDSIIQRTITEIKDDCINEIGDYAFSGCNELTHLEFPEATIMGGYAFNGVSNAETIIIPKASTFGQGFSFKDLKKLRTIQLPENFSIPNSTDLFVRCESLERIDLPSLANIGQYCFRGCKSLREVNVPSALVINLQSFDGCVELVTIDLPSCEEIKGFRQFQNSTKFKALVLRRTDKVCTLNLSNTFLNTPFESGAGYIYVPKALLSDDDETKDYRRATNWSTYGTQFRALEDYTVDGTITGKLDKTKI